jgi:phenylalanyl-tRNA synthetase beta chain
VRRATSGETIKTLDGVERKLEPEMLVIADAARAVAVAGVMGGEDSEISNQTTDVLIESAYFDSDSVRRTARALGMDTEASRRFERGADYGGVIRALDRCVELICETAGGRATENAIDVSVELPPERRIEFHYARVEALTSLCVAIPEMHRILNGLGFMPVESSATPVARDDANASLTYIVPTWRIDVEREEDLVEEIARHTGYDKIASELPAANSSGEYQPKELKCRALRRALAALGYDEAINFSFIDTSHDDQIEPVPDSEASLSADGSVTLQNPIIEDVVRMRPTLIPGLLDSLRHNLNHGRKDVGLFEIGRIFAGSEPRALPRERDALALVTCGGVSEQGRAQATRQVDFQDLKGAMEAAVDATRMTPLSFEAATVKHLREGQTAAIKLMGRTIGSIGRLSESISAAYKFRQPVYVAELDLAALLASDEMAVQYHPLARYPSVVRDVTLLVNREVTFAGLRQTAIDEQIAECRSVQLVGVYEGANIPEDKRSVTLRFEYRADGRTLRDDEVEETHRRLVDVLASKFDAQLH